MLVFGYHVGHGILPFGVLGGGYCGVTFFYVLSGFVLTWGTNPTSGLRRFWVRRFARIYPCHAVVWLLVLILPVVSGATAPRHSLLNLFLLHAWSIDSDDVFAVNGVTWSLSCEAFFYLLFPALFVLTARLRLRTLWPVAIGLYLAATAVVVAGSLAPPEGAFALFVGADPLLRLPEFILGIVGARTLQRGYRLPAWTIVGVLVFSGSGLLLAHGSPSGNSWSAPVWLVLILTVAQLAIDGRPALSRPWMVYAGKVSFAFYLVHQLVINETFHVYGAGARQTLLALVLAVAAAVLLHHLVEVPAHKAIVTRFDAARHKGMASTVAT